jgi:hypothetical protein
MAASSAASSVLNLHVCNPNAPANTQLPPGHPSTAASPLCSAASCYSQHTSATTAHATLCTQVHPACPCWPCVCCPSLTCGTAASCCSQQGHKPSCMQPQPPANTRRWPCVCFASLPHLWDGCQLLQPAHLHGHARLDEPVLTEDVTQRVRGAPVAPARDRQHGAADMLVQILEVCGCAITRRGVDVPCCPFAGTGRKQQAECGTLSTVQA